MKSCARRRRCEKRSCRYNKSNAGNRPIIGPRSCCRENGGKAIDTVTQPARLDRAQFSRPAVWVTNDSLNAEGEIVHNAQALKTSWVLTQTAFDQLLAWLDPDRKRAGEKYEAIRQKVLKFFEWRGCSSPEEYADVTLDRVIRKIEQGEEIRTAEPYLFVLGVAKFVLLEHSRKLEKTPVALDSLAAFQQPAEDPSDSERELETLEKKEKRLACLEKCLQSLAATNRDLVTQYYQGEKREKIQNRKKLAEKLEISLDALRIRAHRIREKLESCVNLCLNPVSEN
jgi:DNA-directed RNA polymerase specialized sigma24 family protein